MCKSSFVDGACTVLEHLVPPRQGLLVQMIFVSFADLGVVYRSGKGLSSLVYQSTTKDEGSLGRLRSEEYVKCVLNPLANIIR